MNVLSLFDGMSCGRIALERAGIPVDNYFASEIDKYAIKVSSTNYPDIIQLGDVSKIDISKLPKIDLLIGGSPCQGFSMAGKQLAFDDPRSKLYFEYERILQELKVINPDIKFLLENVKMKQESKDIITGRLGVNPVTINSNLVSAQSRGRLYWFNWDMLPIEDRQITVKNICHTASDQLDLHSATLQISNILRNSKYSTSFTLKTDQAGRIVVLRPDGLKIQRLGRIALYQHKTEILTTVTQPYIVDNGVVRKVTPVEVERLQTVPDNYTAAVSDSQRYKMLGNGWTVDVISHIFRSMNNENNS